ncbi:PAS domain-containing protein [Uliginosibacterium sp. H3]|uniref:PAS domain-containing protein n=1 Tax=Uliginosibacterium silvisoli TaxID=3114758 RepID=A0ABU6JXS3_9RHOO|nr:PAS domain-containing protein [Uliginosibacterium sp. H3]
MPQNIESLQRELERIRLEREVAQNEVEALRRTNAMLEQQCADTTTHNAELAARIEHLSRAMDASGVGLWTWDSSSANNAGEWSPHLRTILGVPQDIAVTHELFLQCVHEQDRERVNAAIFEAFSGATGGRYVEEYRTAASPERPARWVSAQGQAFLDTAGSPVWFVGVRDVTESKRLQAEIERLSEDFRDLFDEAPIPYVHEAMDTRFIRANRAAMSLLGVGPDDLSGTFSHSFAVDSPENLQRLTSALESVERGEAVQGVVLELRRKDNQPVWVEWWSRPAASGGFTRTMLVDITERVLLEQAKNALEFTLKSGLVGDWNLDLVHDTSRRSLRHDQCFGYDAPIPEANWGIKEFIKHVHPDDRVRVEESLRHAVQALLDWSQEFRVIWPDGSLHWLAARGSIYRSSEGRATQMLGIVMDISERKSAEEALRASGQIARGQVRALGSSLALLAREPSADRLVGHMLCALNEQCGGHSSSVWLRNKVTGVIEFEFAFEDDFVVPKSDVRFAGMSLGLPMEEVWPWPEVFRTGKPSLIEDIREVPPFPLRDRLLDLGIVTVLLVPMFSGGELEGAIGIRFVGSREFRNEEVDLAQALANQAMLAIQLARLSAESRDAAVMAERNRMARDIHDTLAQGFTGVIVQLEAASEARSKSLPAEVEMHLQRASELARESLNEARRSVRALRPLALEDKDLAAALDSLFTRMTAGTALQAAFNVKGPVKKLPPEWEENLLRISQEVLTNALRHAHARHFQVSLAFADGALSLLLRDDGQGFDPEGRHDGFGLIGIRERVNVMGGAVSIESVIGAGTQIAIDLPYAQRKATA